MYVNQFILKLPENFRKTSENFGNYLKHFPEIFQNYSEVS